MNCQRCQTNHETSARFCPQCGWDLQKPFYSVQWNVRSVCIILLLAGFLWGTCYTLQSSKSGIKPTKQYEEAQEVTRASLDPELMKLKEAAEKHQDNIEAQRLYARSLLEQLKKSEEPDQSIMLEATDAFGAWIRLSPKDPEALIAMADLSFNAKVFDKAGDLYRRYLQEKPEDLAARARYASSLAFVGKSELAVKELQSVLAKDPENFHALAYMAIAYAQLGNMARAKEVGLKALDRAPSPEAHSRFKEFLDALETEGQKPESQGGGAAALAAFVASNPVAGPKYVSFSQPSHSELVISLRNFPMQSMPPFAKQKFFAGLRDKSAQLGLKDLEKITFVDADSGQAMDTLPLTEGRP